ncbi:uncharacterized protein CBO05P1_181 [Clostridium botulinum B str. Osaka05]|uniref:Uncharacterized protein n=1 Tax=Clostridium botulinum B str. Osaka05 TaxID=1407017 RepID=A0A060N5R5_CLOBO|nr:hypothetical protein [Clostridium botulinum]BAO04900.1 uncharacterized protein CBO05P1_181 [Clostridium botulinum B str. Osaka05]
MNFEKLIDLGKRVYNGKMIEEKDKEGNITLSDEKDIKALCKKVFNDGSVTPDPSLLHNFNNIIVKLAEEVAQPRVTEFMNILANYQKANRGDVVLYRTQPKDKVDWAWSALGSGIDFIRISPNTKQIPAIGKPMHFGAYYEPLDMVKNSVEAFRKAVNDLADAKVELYYTKIMETIRQAVADTTIPSNQIKTGTNLPLKDYRGLEDRMIRLSGSRPILVGDFLLVNHFSDQQATDAVYSKLITDKVKESLLADLNITAFSRTVAFNINNPWIDLQNTKVKFNPSEGFMFAGGTKNQSPINVTEFGQMMQDTRTTFEDERVLLKVTLEADITLISGRNIAYIKDDSIKA